MDELVRFLGGAIVWACILVAIWAWSPWDKIFSGEELTSYPARCGPASTRTHCDLIVMDRTKFRIHASALQVAYSSIDNPTEPQRLVNCSILDNENWSCQTPSIGLKVVFRDGREVLEASSVRLGEVRLRKWQWRLANWLPGKYDREVFLPEQYTR